MFEHFAIIMQQHCVSLSPRDCEHGILQLCHQPTRLHSALRYLAYVQFDSADSASGDVLAGV